MTLEQQQHENSYKSPQSPSFRAYHHSNQQPYKIPSQNVNYQNRMMMRQSSPPHTSGSIGKSMSFQQQQPLQQNSAAAIKESYRSNSLPINANIQLPKDMMSGVSCDFAVPKYPNASSNAIVSAQTSKSRSSRARSNSINLRHGQLVMTPIQSATSEPTLNANASSALAQLLTNSSVSSLLSQKAQSVSSSAMSHTTPQQHQQPQRANSFTSSSLVQNSILMAVSSMNNQKQSSNQAPSTSSGIYHTPTLSPESAFDNSHHEMSSSMSPERCLSLSKYHPRENQRRAGHIHAEQKRRYNIKNGFDMLHQLIPQLQQNPNAKVFEKFL